MDKLRNEETDLFFKCVLELKTLDECYDFFEDACTINEIANVAFRATYATIISQSQIDYMIDWMYSEDTIKKEIADKVTYLLLETEGR